MKVGIATVTTGFNYGTSLQAYASKLNLEKMGYQADILGYKSSLIKGRDVRLKKLVIMLTKVIFDLKLFKKTYLIYKRSITKKKSIETKKMFMEFTEKKLCIKKLTYSEMKEYALEKQTKAVICGSDQIWNLTALYVDPFYYLQFCPRNKRIAYAPSFGKTEIQRYNKNTIAKYLNEFDFISVREEAGKEIVQKLVNKVAEVHIDPTLLITKEEWKKEFDNSRIINEEYILTYFLDTPNKLALDQIKKIASKLKIRKIINIPIEMDEIKKMNILVETVDSGPLEFLNLVLNSKFIFTDSFHGMLFSINFNVPFYIFQRNYGVETNQSSRISSILRKLNLKERFLETEINNLEPQDSIEWSIVNRLLNEERIKSKEYLEKHLNRR